MGLGIAAPMRSFAQAASAEEIVVPSRVVQIDGLVRVPFTCSRSIQVWRIRSCFCSWGGGGCETGVLRVILWAGFLVVYANGVL